MSRDCHIDLESYSEQLLPKVGVHRYAEDPSTEILVICFAFGNEPVNVWIPYRIPKELERQMQSYVRQLNAEAKAGVKGGLVYIGRKVPERLRWHAERGGRFRAHNSQFERVMFRGRPGQKIRFPKTELNQWYCTAAKAAVLALPRDLDRLSSKNALDTPHKKDEDGKGDMLRITKPRKPSKHNPATRWTPENAPEKFYKMYRYCIDDVQTERDCDQRMPELSRRERRIFLLDQKINDRGWMIDQERIADAQFLIAQYKQKLQKRCRELTGVNPTQTEKFAEWVRAQGVEIENLQAQTIKDALKRKDLPRTARWALRIRQLHEMKAPAKYTAMERAVCADGALRGMFLYSGASTHRWSGRIVQLHNLFRSVILDAEVAIDAFALRSISWLKFLYEKNPMQIFASCIRGMLIARPGRDLVFCDFNSIEARIVAWLADQKDILQIFATHGLVYEYTAARMFGLSTDVETLKMMKKAHPMKRFLGKIATLACGYAGGQAAFTKMSKQFGVNISNERAERIKNEWRKANPKIVQMWYDVEDAAKNAVLNPGVTYVTNRLAFRVVGDFLCMRVPSKSKLYYYKPFIQHDELRFWGIDTYTRQWKICSTYSGKIVQNACEKIARDLMTTAMLKLNKKRIYPMLGTVHDEIVTEPREGKGSVAEVCRIMCDKPKWATGLPVAAEGHRTKRYRK